LHPPQPGRVLRLSQARRMDRRQLLPVDLPAAAINPLVEAIFPALQSLAQPLPRMRFHSKR
jgi:hypothetical protein